MDSLVYDIKTEDFYEDIADDVPARFDTSGYRPNRPLPVGLNKKVIGLMKHELGGKIMTDFMALRPRLYSYKKLDGSEDKKCKGIKKCIVKKTLTFEDYKTCLFNNSTEYRSQLMFRSAKHEVHTIEVNKVALNRDDDKLECYMDWFLSLICKNYIFKYFVETIEPTSLKFCMIIELIILHLEYTIAHVKYANFSYAHAQTFVLLNGEMATVSTGFRKLKFWLWLLWTVFYLNQTGF